MKYVGVAVVLGATLAFGMRSPSEGSAGIDSEIVYVEFQATDLAKTKVFFERTFGWNFAEQTPTYFTFFDGRISGGFTKSSRYGTRKSGSALISIYSEDLDDAKRMVLANGGKIVQDIVADVGKRQFVFEEPSGNEFAVVSSK